MATNQTVSDARTRVSVELSQPVLSLLDNACGVTGLTRTQVLNDALLQVLPSLVERADLIAKLAQQKSQQQKRR